MGMGVAPVSSSQAGTAGDGGVPRRSRALVLGGGGVVGIAWEIGVLTGLADEGVDLSNADVIIGTSAGATVAAQLTSGVALSELFARQLLPPEQSGEARIRIERAAIVEFFTSAARGATSPAAARAAIGAASVAAPTMDEAQRRAVIERRLPRPSWPDQCVRIVAVDATSGDVAVFDHTSGVELVDAIAASTAVPGVFPPATVHGRRYIDGGIRSVTNADLAGEHDAVVVVSPFVVGRLPFVEASVTAAIAALLARPSTVAIGADEAALAAMGTNSLDPANRAPSARAGRAQGRAAAVAVAAVW